MRRLKTCICRVVAGALTLAPVHAVAQGDTGSVATRLPPSAFPDLPSALQKDLERRGCTIPQVPTDSTPHNVLHGRFRRAKQGDWAVLCSVHGYSSILVFWGGSPQHPGEVAVATDADCIRATDSAPPRFDRVIALADSAAIPKTQPVLITHDGIRDVCGGKRSLHYWDDDPKRWIPLVTGR
jgi:hypothetical protein